MWYFMTRESVTPLGPYSTEAEVQRVAMDYVAFAMVANEEMTVRCYQHLADVG